MNRFYSRVTFIIEMKRKTGYYLISVILPCVMLVFMTLISFCLPPDSGEKVGLGVTIILAFSVYQIMIAESPPIISDATPVLSEYTLCLALNRIHHCCHGDVHLNRVDGSQHRCSVFPPHGSKIIVSQITYVSSSSSNVSLIHP